MVTEVFQRLPALPFRTLDDETVVVNVQTREVHLLNPTGSRIWTLLAPARSLEEVVSALADEFELDAAAEAPSEVAAFIRQLLDRGLVVATRRDDP